MLSFPEESPEHALTERESTKAMGRAVKARLMVLLDMGVDMSVVGMGVRIRDGPLGWCSGGARVVLGLALRGSGGRGPGQRPG
ncbi:hypothetical protein GCM10017557_81640 [Streptomyces aurantiacus]|uniref:Uncharacterized protein n=1 Tax=Streptomyces aurantiacus TaxID=47760 RepID=A0A7G1PHV1_9ACTN|nr:hypothetical protein GCM10017557_81640 [Streptomyces aurantiacus]